MKNYLEQLKKTIVRKTATHILKKRESVIDQLRMPITSEMLLHINRSRCASGNISTYVDESEYKKSILYKNATLFTEREIEELYKEIEAGKKLVK